MEITNYNNFKVMYSDYEVDSQNQKKINNMVDKKKRFIIYWVMFFILSLLIIFPVMVYLKFYYIGKFIFIFFLFIVCGFLYLSYRSKLFCSSCKKRMSKISVKIVDFNDSDYGWYDTYFLCKSCKLKVDAKLTIE